MVPRALEESLVEAAGAVLKIPALLNDGALRHREFPITATRFFLAHAASSPLPSRSAEAMAKYIMQASAEGQWAYIHHDVETETRHYAAELLGADQQEIALVASTSAGLNIVASGLDWQSGDSVIIADGDFPANIYPWLNLERRGVQVRMIPRRKDGAVLLPDVISLLDERTRLVSLSSVNYLTGFRADIDSIGKYLSSRGILFCVDAIQSAGTLPIEIEHVDFLAAGANKWLLGPLGTGILYVKKRHFPRLRPSWVGWKSVRDSHKYTEYDLTFPDTASRFEPTPVCVSGLIGLHAALKLILGVGVADIAARLVEMRRRMVPVLLQKGYEVLGGDDPQWDSGITSFTSDVVDITALQKRLDESGYVVSLRGGLTGGRFIRVSPHFYNTDEEINRFLNFLP
jgi:selenocysteine lyase/cysteine desulfurase